jgi:hypothetical protein
MFPWLLAGEISFAQVIFSDQKMYHLRAGDQPQWSEFSGKPYGASLELTFDAPTTEGNQSLFLRQYSVMQEWQVILNGHILGRLTEDEKDMISSYDIPSGVIKQVENKLRIEISPKKPPTISNDIRVGELVIDSRPKERVLFECKLEVEIREGDRLIPSRLTIADQNGVLQPIGGVSDENLAIRPGFVYTGNGKIIINLAAGTYRLFATRGFEYGVDSTLVVIRPGEHITRKFNLRHEVQTPGWVGSDTHIHTFTHSRHGDATDEERLLSIAGEGLELPVITDHNVYVDLNPLAKKLRLDPYFTIVNGVELTTSVGHFNVFPVDPAGKMINFKIKNWDELAGRINRKQAIILNHARDIHSGFRPFDPSRHIASAGMTLTGWQFPAYAMEVINSGAMQSDAMRLYNDWFGLLNRGYPVTPAGATDTHTVSRYLLGQARTYIRVKNDNPDSIDEKDAIEHFRNGKVMVSFGLLTEISIDQKYGSGDTAQVSGKEISVSIRVSGPGWTAVDYIALYANGKKIRAVKIAEGRKAGVKWTGKFNIPLSKQDVFLVAIAEGPGNNGPFWQIARPYQASSLDWTPRVMGSSGAVFIDADHDKTWTSAFDYAQELTDAFQNNVPKLIARLGAFDESVSVQAASLWHRKGFSLDKLVKSKFFEAASQPVKSGFRTFMDENSLSDLAPVPK